MVANIVEKLTILTDTLQRYAAAHSKFVNIILFTLLTIPLINQINVPKQMSPHFVMTQLKSHNKNRKPTVLNSVNTIMRIIIRLHKNGNSKHNDNIACVSQWYQHVN